MRARMNVLVFMDRNRKQGAEVAKAGKILSQSWHLGATSITFLSKFYSMFTNSDLQLAVAVPHKNIALSSVA